MKCVIDQRRDIETGQVCPGCRQWLDRTLTEIVELYATLPAHMIPGQVQGQRVSGSREAPLPLRVDPLDLTMPARYAVVHDTAGDQIGLPSVASVLDSWARDWADVRDMGETLPDPTVAELARWLGNRHDWAADNHHAVSDYADELRELRAVIRRYTGGPEPYATPCIGVPCRRCDLTTLAKLANGSGDVECQNGDCRLVYRPDEYDAWVRLVAASIHKASLPA